MEFEFDPNKSQINQQKHGINFVDAQILWDDLDYLEIPARSTTESRSLIIGTIKNQIWTAVITYRDNKVRIISVRRARREEVMLYENE